MLDSECGPGFRGERAKSENQGCRSTLSMTKIKVKISETKYRSFYKTLVLEVKKSPKKDGKWLSYCNFNFAKSDI